MYTKWKTKTKGRQYTSYKPKKKQGNQFLFPQQGYHNAGQDPLNATQAWPHIGPFYILLIARKQSLKSDKKNNEKNKKAKIKT